MTEILSAILIKKKSSEMLYFHNACPGRMGKNKINVLDTPECLISGEAM